VIRRLLFVVVAARALGPSASAGAARGRDWLLLASDRDGTQRAYSMRRDGSRLSPVLSSDLALVPEGTTRDGRLLAYRGPQDAIYVSRADGTGLRRLVRSGDVEGFSPDGKLLAFSGPIDSVIRVVGTNGRWISRATSSSPRRRQASSCGGSAQVGRSRSRPGPA
jgi:Tol biopolymer transport system component